MKLVEGVVAFFLVTALVSPTFVQADASSVPPTATGRQHAPLDSSQAMSSAGFRTLPVSDIRGMTLYNSKGAAFGKVRQVVRNQSGHDSIVVAREASSGGDVEIPIENVVIHSDRLFAHGLGDDQLRAMPIAKVDGNPQVEDSKTVMIGAEN